MAPRCYAWEVDREEAAGLHEVPVDGAGRPSGQRS